MASKIHPYLPMRVHKTRGCFVLIIILLSSLSAVVQAQAPARPDRGVSNLGSYAISDIENINLSNGNVNISIPLAALPPMPGGKLSWVLRAVYNSKLWDTPKREVRPPDPVTNPDYVVDYLQNSSLGGWLVGAGYQINVQNSHQDFNWQPPKSPSDPDYYLLTQNGWFKVILTTPDGATHELRPNGSLSFGGLRDYLRGYFNSTPASTTPQQKMSYYSFDGSYIWATVDPYQTVPTVWTVYMPDGTRIEHNNGIQRIRDTNGNSVKIFTVDDPATGISTTHYQEEQTLNPVREILLIHYPAGNQRVQYQTVGGATMNIDLNWGTTVVQGKAYTTTEPCLSTTVITTTELAVLRSIVLPPTEPGVAGRQFTFGYNSDSSASINLNPNPTCAPPLPPNPILTAAGWGSLSHIAMPSGATVDYVYSLNGASSSPTDAIEVPKEYISQKTVTHDGTTDTWMYSSGMAGGSVSGPDGSTIIETAYTHHPNMGMIFGGVDGLGGLVYRTKYSEKRMIERHWTPLVFNTGERAAPGGLAVFNPVVDVEYTSLLEGINVPVKMSAKKFQYDFNGNLVRVDEYDWFDPALVTRDANGVPTAVPLSATLLRSTINTFHSAASTAGSTNVYAKRSLTTATPLILNAMRDSTLGASLTKLSYDSQLFDVPPTTGNLTREDRCDNGNSQCVTTQHAYDLKGNRTSTTDPRGNVTSFFYGDAAQAQPTQISVGPLTTSTSYDYWTGRVTSQTDPNNNVMTTDYTNQLLGTVDPFGRPGVVTGPQVTVNLGGVISTQQRKVVSTYEDSLRRVTTESDLNATGDRKFKSRTTLDQLGRAVLTESSENGISYGISSSTVYSQMGKITLMSNPSRGIVESTDGWTRTTRDELGRVTEVATFAGAAQPPLTGTNANWTGSVTTDYNAHETTVTDQAGKPRRSLTDALGRLIRVDEPDKDTSALGISSSPVQPTLYQYDALDNLISVQQGAQTRTFSYDALKRLTSATNPESGTVTYQYDANGNLLSKTDARGVITSYQYDVLNRVTQKSYSGLPPSVTATPTVTYTYDAVGVTNSKGRLTQVSSTASTTNYTSYDARGRVQGSSQTTDGITYPFSYGYNLAGGMTSQTYPSGRAITTNYDAAGRISSVLGPSNKTYATLSNYAVQGAATSMTLGNTLVETSDFNSRLQQTSINLGTLASFGYNYGTTNNNGNVVYQTIGAPGFSVTQNYTYDALNRLTSVNENGVWSQTYGYDRYGNRTSVVSPTYLPTFAPAPTVNSSNNRFIDANFFYDAAGNLTQEPIAPGSGTLRNYTYDAENRLTNFNNWTATYVYDGDGRRVKKTVGTTTTTIFVYNVLGQLITEHTNPVPTSNGGTSYLTADHLGSTRVVTNSTGNVIARHDYLPFGEEIPSTIGGRTLGLNYAIDDGIRQRFTAKERDGESGLDYFLARHQSGPQGRFTGPDPIFVTTRRMLDPQELSLYAYVRNNPLRFVDPNGEDLVIYWFYNKDLTDEQKKYLRAHMREIQAVITDKFKKAGVDKVEFREGTQLTQKQIDKILQMGRKTDTTGIGLLNFADKSFGGYTSDEKTPGGTGKDNRSAVFLGRLQPGLNLQNTDDANTLTFRLGEVGAHELGHGQGFESDGEVLNFILSIFGQGNLMGEGQGIPSRPKYFNPSQDKTQRAIKEINKIGDNTPKQ